MMYDYEVGVIRPDQLPKLVPFSRRGFGYEAVFMMYDYEVGVKLSFGLITTP